MNEKLFKKECSYKFEQKVKICIIRTKEVTDTIVKVI